MPTRQLAYVGRKILAEDHADQRVEFIDVAHGGDARRVLGGATEPSPRPVVPASPVRV
jgi:hypothetical protein